jgi:phage terminase small subunit
MAKYVEIELATGEKIKLTERELIFCDHYLGDANRNATQSAIKAGYSLKTARNIATENLSKPHISKYLDSKTKPFLEQIGVNRDRILQEWATLGLSNITDYMNDDYSIKNLDEVRKSATGAIDSVKIEERVLMKDEASGGVVMDRKVEFKLHNKIKALEKLSEIMGIVVKKEEPGVGATTVNNYTFHQNILNKYNSND